VGPQKKAGNGSEGFTSKRSCRALFVLLVVTRSNNQTGAGKSLSTEQFIAKTLCAINRIVQFQNRMRVLGTLKGQGLSSASFRYSRMA
jgi:hypothetical protein